MTHHERTTIPLDGIDGANPLGFLAAVGTLVALDRCLRQRRPAIGWSARLGAWRPRLSIDGPLDNDALVADLDQALKRMGDHPALAIGDDLNLACDRFRGILLQARSGATPRDRTFVDLAAAFGSEAIEARDNGKPNGKISDTALRTMSGAGNQHFIRTIRGFVRDTTPDHLRRALFRPWSYDDPAKNYSMRWDPVDDVRYALRWRNPSGDPARGKVGSVWGANRLAIEALMLLPTAPRRRRLETTGFKERPREGVFWTWPIWSGLLGADPVRSLLALAELQRPRPRRDRLQRMGIVEVYRAQRITQDKFRNFTQGVPA